MSNIVERLRNRNMGILTSEERVILIMGLLNEAADEIERLTAENSVLREEIERLKALEGEARHVYGVMDHSGQATAVNFKGMEVAFDRLKEIRDGL